MKRIIGVFASAYVCNSINITKCDDKLFDCEQPVCKPKINMLLKSMENLKNKENENSMGKNITVENVPNNMTTSIPSQNHGCPFDRDDLGRSTWNLLHTIATYYPDKPTDEQKIAMIQLLKGLAEFYPCNICRPDFYKIISTTDLNYVVINRESVSIFICTLHNEVNNKLNKPLFTCDLESLDERWQKSTRSECNEVENINNDEMEHS